MNRNYFTEGLAEFLRKNPGLTANLKSEAAKHAANLGVSEEKFFETQSISSYAQSLKLQGVNDIFSYHVNKYEKDPDVAREVIVNHHKSHAEAIGLSWEEYRLLNNI